MDLKCFCKIDINYFKRGITDANLSILKTGKAKAIKFSTLCAICKALDAQPGDLLEFIDDEEKQK